MKSSGVIYYHDWNYVPHPLARPAKPTSQVKAKAVTNDWSFAVGLGCLALSLGGLLGPLYPTARLEAQYALSQGQAATQRFVAQLLSDSKPVSAQAQPSAPKQAQFSLVTPSGSSIDPVDTNFGIVIPKIGVNAKIIASVDPTKPREYTEVLKSGIAHASTSFLPGENGTVYLFSHSTNYDWFVSDLNAVFYLLKNLELEDKIAVFYEGKRYVYQISDKRIVSPTAVSYLVPQKGAQRLILQTCWPPGSTTERLLIFADLVEAPEHSP